MYYNISEEELKNKVGQDFFKAYDTTRIIGKVDFCIAPKNQTSLDEDFTSHVWAEAKKGNPNIQHSIVQLILTIGKARTFDTHLPPKFLGAFDYEKMAFIPYSDIHDIFYMNDFNWNVAPSNHETREFELVLSRVKSILEEKSLVYYFDEDGQNLKQFIKDNLTIGDGGVTKTKIDKNNFIAVYNKWLSKVRPSINAPLKFKLFLDRDFYLADLMSKNNNAIKKELHVLLRNDQYALNRTVDEEEEMVTTTEVKFKDKQKAHTEFWNIYERPPKEEYQDYILERQDLLVPQDIREIKGSYFTPSIWVERSQEYLAQTFGENWQEEYTVWDCAAGTGNLLSGLTNKYNIYASTLDKADVAVMRDRILNGANLLEDHVFQFDFLSDGFDKLPKGLQAIINDPKKRKKLIIYINPPYAEATSTATVTGTGSNKDGVATDHKLHAELKTHIGKAANELFALFMARIYKEMEGSKLGLFSTLKITNSTNFKEFRQFFQAKYLKGFMVPADTFDNVTGKFPIGFTIWDTDNKKMIEEMVVDVYNKTGLNEGTKTFHSNLPVSINKWITQFNKKEKESIGLIVSCSPDFQHNSQVTILSKQQERYCYSIIKENLLPISIYLTVRHVFPHTWINHNDQFLYPNDGWKTDTHFQNNCLAYTLFHGKNRVTSKEGVNHWTPFTETEVNAKTKFESNFMTDFMAGKIRKEKDIEQFEDSNSMIPTQPLVFSKEAQAVFKAGLELWRYYHSQKHDNVNASYYDIKEFFQGRSEKTGNLNSKSNDKEYNQLHHNLKLAMDNLEAVIQPKVYEYGFLKA